MLILAVSQKAALVQFDILKWFAYFLSFGGSGVGSGVGFGVGFGVGLGVGFLLHSG